MNIFLGFGLLYLILGFVFMGLAFTFEPEFYEAWLGMWLCSGLCTAVGVYVWRQESER